MNVHLITALCLLTLTGTAVAIESGASSATQKQTEAWLELQASGKVASTIPQTQAPVERDQSMQRWLNNYQHPIPEFFEQKKGGTVSGGSGAN